MADGVEGDEVRGGGSLELPAMELEKRIRLAATVVSSSLFMRV
jgi:hypothetical protein